MAQTNSNDSLDIQDPWTGKQKDEDSTSLSKQDISSSDKNCFDKINPEKEDNASDLSPGAQSEPISNSPSYSPEAQSEPISNSPSYSPDAKTNSTPKNNSSLANSKKIKAKNEEILPQKLSSSKLVGRININRRRKSSIIKTFTNTKFVLKTITAIIALFALRVLAIIF